MDQPEHQGWPRQLRDDFRAMVDIAHYGVAVAVALLGLLLATMLAPDGLFTEPANPTNAEIDQSSGVGMVFSAIAAGLMLYFWCIAPALRLFRSAQFGAALRANLARLLAAVLPLAGILGVILAVFACSAQLVAMTAGPASWPSSTANVVIVVIVLSAGFQLHVMAHRRAHRAFGLGYDKPSPVRRLLAFLGRANAG